MIFPSFLAQRSVTTSDTYETVERRKYICLHDIKYLQFYFSNFLFWAITYYYVVCVYYPALRMWRRLTGVIKFQVKLQTRTTFSFDGCSRIYA